VQRTCEHGDVSETDDVSDAEGRAGVVRCRGNRNGRLSRLIGMPRFAFCAVVLGLLVTACGSSRPGAATSADASLTSQSGAAQSSGRVGSAAAGLKKVSFNGVQLSIPALWPVIDGAHARNLCSSTFAGQADRAFLGVSYQGVPGCPVSSPSSIPLPVDGLWMQPGGSNPPSGTPTMLPGGQSVYLSTDTRDAAVTVWYHRVSIQIGVGPNPAVERAILDSIAFNPAATDTAVLGRCPSPDPSPPIMPVPTRLTAPLAPDDGNAHMQPEPSTVRPRVSAASVWASLFHDFGAGGYSGPLQWSMVFGSYSAQTPATINPDGSMTPNYRHVPTWLIRGEGIKTPYGPCGITVLAPYNADTGHGMGVETIG
jgi:hypothetical protein